MYFNRDGWLILKAMVLHPWRMWRGVRCALYFAVGELFVRHGRALWVKQFPATLEARKWGADRSNR